MIITPPSLREEFKDFDSFYQESIAPFFRTKEEERQKAVRRSALIAIVTAVLGFGLFHSGLLGELRTPVAMAVGFLGFSGASWALTKTRDDITSGLLERICTKLGLRYRCDLGRPDYFEDFDRLKLMPRFNREAWEDEVRGERHGASFVFCEAHLKYKASGKRNSVKTVFHGQLLVIDYHKDFQGETIIKRDRGVFNRLMKPGKEFHNVGIASPEFEKTFEAWSTDQVEARDLLDPLVLERFSALNELFDGANLRAAFTGGKLIVAMETGDKLNMGSMFKPLSGADRPGASRPGADRVEKILKEFDLIFDLTDVILKQINHRLDGAFSVEVVRSP